MGLTPIPCIPPPVGEYLSDGNGGLIDVSAYQPDPNEAFRRSITPREQSWGWEALNLATVLCLLAVVLLPLLWWLA